MGYNRTFALWQDGDAETSLVGWLTCTIYHSTNISGCRNSTVTRLTTLWEITRISVKYGPLCWLGSFLPPTSNIIFSNFPQGSQTANQLILVAAVKS